MALSKAKVREILSAAGVDSEHMSAAVDAIIDGNVASIEALREDVARYKAEAEKLEAVQKELSELKAKGGDDYKTRAEKAEKELKDYKAEIAAKETKAAKEKAARAYFEAKNITGSNLAIALRGAKDEIAGIELDENGGIKDTKTLDALVGGEFAGLVVKSSTRGANIATPPDKSTSPGAKTKAEILAIKDTSQRQAAWAEYIAANQPQKG